MKSLLTRPFLIACLVLSLSAAAQTGVYMPQLANFDTAMAGFIDRYNVPGAELAITYRGRLVYNRGFGYADTSSHVAVQPDHIFRLASASKPITAITIMYLVEKGLLNLNDTVFGAHGILNDTMYQNCMDPRAYHITVKNLLNHSGGWNSSISGDPMFNSYNIATVMGMPPPADAITIIRYTLRYKLLDFNPGTQDQYSNFGFCILGRIIEKVTGQSYESYVRNEILLPLGISSMHTGFNLLSNQLPMEVTYYDYPNAPLWPSVYDNVTPVPDPYGGFNIEAMDAHGGWVASAGDLCKLLAAVDGFSTRPDILSAASINTMTHPSPTNANYALGWGVDANHNWWHDGAFSGTASGIVRTNSQVNWVILLNTLSYDYISLLTAMDQLVVNVLPTIQNWPANDLFATGIEEIPAESLIRVFPNPSDGKFTITAGSAISSIDIYSMLGEKIYSNAEFGGGRPLEVDLSDAPKGIYFVKARNGLTVCNKKIIVR